MKKTLTAALILTVLSAQAWAFTGAVTRVHDGDTLTVDGRRVRLFGIDAPELDQPGGAASREYLARLVQGRSVEVVEKDIDAYGRVVGVVLAHDGREVNAMMVRAGHAWVYRTYCRDCAELKRDEALARREGLGLWGEPRPVPPWKWRKQSRSEH